MRLLNEAVQSKNDSHAQSSIITKLCLKTGVSSVLSPPRPGLSLLSQPSSSLSKIRVKRVMLFLKASEPDTSASELHKTHAAHKGVSINHNMHTVHTHAEKGIYHLWAKCCVHFVQMSYEGTTIWKQHKHGQTEITAVLKHLRLFPQTTCL